MKLFQESYPDLQEIRKAIRDKIAEVSISERGSFQYPIGKDGAKALGYDPADIESAHTRFFESLCVVGNPFLLGNIRLRAGVLDLGCGAGFDLFVASKLVGERGLVCRNRFNGNYGNAGQERISPLQGITNFEIKKVDSETIPFL